MDKYSETQLCLLAHIGDFESVRLLLASGVAVDCRNERKLTPLLASLSNTEAFKVTKLLIAKGANVNLPIPDTLLTPLHVAARDGNAAAVKALLLAGADVRAVDAMRRSVLHWAAIGSPPYVLKKLLKLTHGDGVNAADEGGYTPLLAAAEHGRTENVELLLAAGADVRARNTLCHSAIELADWMGHKAVVEALEAAHRRAGVPVLLSVAPGPGAYTVMGALPSSGTSLSDPLTAASHTFPARPQLGGALLSAGVMPAPAPAPAAATSSSGGGGAGTE